MAKGARVNAIIVALSLLGGAGMCIGYFFSPQKRLRQKLVLGLGIVDCLQALVVLVGTANTLAGHTMGENSPACQVSGFLYQASCGARACVVASASWTLAVAIVTYSTLVHPLSRLTVSLESRWSFLVIWIIVWMSGLIPAAVGTAVFEQVDGGGVCWYTANSIQSKLMIFVPRAITLLTVTALYIRLFAFFRKRERSLLQTSMTGTGSEEGETGHRGSVIAIGRSLTSWGRTNVSAPTTESSTPPDLKFSSFTSPALSPIHSPMVTSNPPQRHVFITLPQQHASPELEEPETPDLDPSVFPPVLSPRDTKRASRLEHEAFAARQAAAPPVKKRLSPRQINRRTSVLMMLYPLAYLLLFSVSVAKLIVSIATNKPTHAVLTDIARWLVYAQGFVDGLIYLVIETYFRKMNKGRT